jgi:hypothetical protein
LLHVINDIYTNTHRLYADKCGLLAAFVSLTFHSSVSFIMRAYVVVPKVPFAYVAIGFQSVVGLLAVIFDVVSKSPQRFIDARKPIQHRLGANCSDIVYRIF